MLQRILYKIYFALAFLFILPQSAFALTAKQKLEQGLNATAEGTGHIDPTNAGNDMPTDIMAVISNAIAVFLSVLGILFLFLMIYGGLIWMNARGQEQALTKAKSIIRNSIIGLVIVFAAYAISAFIFDNIIGF